MVELDSALGTEDLYDLLEIIAVDAHNRIAAQKESSNGNSN